MVALVEFNPLSAEFFADPYDTYRRLRDEAPVSSTIGSASMRSAALPTWYGPTATGRRSVRRGASGSTS